MHRDDFHAFCSQNNFQPVGRIQQDAGRLRIVLDSHPRAREGGWVYLWVREDGAGCEVVYAGKADQSSLKARMGQHTGGFRDSTRGRTHAARLAEGLAQEGVGFRVYARKSGTADFFGHEVSLCAAEEAAAIARFAPDWNHTPRQGVRR